VADAQLDGHRRFHGHQKLLVEVALVRRRRHLHTHHRQPGGAALRVEAAAVLAQEALHDAGFAHAGGPEQQQRRHAIVRRVGQQIAQARQNSLGPGVL